ncbi:hypothetical protein D3C72_1356840 [compost metagenome]
MLREEDQVHADEHDPEVQLAEELGVHVAGHLREPVVPGSEDREHGAERQNVVEVSNHVVGVMQRTVEAGVGELNARNATDGEQEDEADRPDHRGREGQRTAPHGRDPREDLDTRRHRDDHGGEDEITLRFERQADRIHVVGPDDEADGADGDHGVGHGEVAEDRLARESGNDVADDAEARQDQDVDFRVTEEPEQVLEQDRVAAAFRREEGRAEVAVRQEHGDTACQNRQREQQQEGGDQNRPGKQRHLVQRHARSAHVQDRGDEVDRTEDRRGAGNVQAEDHEIHRRPGHARRREWWIDRPSASRAIGACRTFDEH